MDLISLNHTHSAKNPPHGAFSCSCKVNGAACITGGANFINDASGGAGTVVVTSFRKTRGSVRGVLALAAQILLPIEGLCSKLTYVPISLVARAGSACLTALKDPTTCAPVPHAPPASVQHTKAVDAMRASADPHS